MEDSVEDGGRWWQLPQHQSRRRTGTEWTHSLGLSWLWLTPRFKSAPTEHRDCSKILVAIHSHGPPSYHALADWETIKMGIPTVPPATAEPALGKLLSSTPTVYHGWLLENGQPSLIQCNPFPPHVFISIFTICYSNCNHTFSGRNLVLIDIPTSHISGATTTWSAWCCRRWSRQWARHLSSSGGSGWQYDPITILRMIMHGKITYEYCIILYSALESSHCTMVATVIVDF